MLHDRKCPTYDVAIQHCWVDFAVSDVISFMSSDSSSP
jgi:hypothetical protein